MDREKRTLKKFPDLLIFVRKRTEALVPQIIAAQGLCNQQIRKPFQDAAAGYFIAPLPMWGAVWVVSLWSSSIILEQAALCNFLI